MSNPNQGATTSTANATQSEPCPGIEIEWIPGTVWSTYPVLLHDTRNVPWHFQSFREKKVLPAESISLIGLQALDCEFPETGTDGSTPCPPCVNLPNSNQFRQTVARAQETAVNSHTPLELLTAQQLQSTAKSKARSHMRLRTEVNLFCQ
jgi:hypothetical protein